MKTIAPAAMAAIEAGKAIVTGAVEIIPRATVNYTTVGTIDLDALTDAATTAAGGLLVGTTLSGFAPTDIVRITLPAGLTFTAWSPWGSPSPITPYAPNAPLPYNSGSTNYFDVIPDGVAADTFRVGDYVPYDGYAAARAAFGSRTFDGASAYHFYILDTPTGDNSGGLSITVERGVAVGTGDPIRVWGGNGPIPLDGEEYFGIGHRGLAQQAAGAVGGVAQGMVLTLSGIDPELLALLDADEIKGASVVIRRLIFASDGKTLLDTAVFDRGRVDTVDTDEVIGGDAAIRIGVESAARGLGRSGARQRSDSDQRLINPTDGYFRNAAYAAEKMLYWGGKRPHRVGGVGGIGSSGGSIGGGGGGFFSGGGLR